MTDKSSSLPDIIDYITGKPVPDVGAEANRQMVEKYLVEDRGFSPEEIEVDAPVEITVNGEPYASRLDLAVSVNGTRIMALKCAAGSIGSREREIVSGARIAGPLQIPVAVSTDGRDASVLNALTGKKIGKGMEAIPTRTEAERFLSENPPAPLAEKKVEREKIVFKSFDSMNVNVARQG